MKVPMVQLTDIDMTVLRTVIMRLFDIGTMLRSKQVIEQSEVRTAHAAHADFLSFNSVAARAMRRHAAELGLVYLRPGDSRSGGAYWQRVA